jgi:hypothetical protein
VPHQEALTVIARIRPGQVQTVKGILGTIAEHRGRWDIVPFAKLANVHFARFVVFDETADLDGNPIPPQLAMMTNVDAPLDAHLRDLTTTCGDGLDKVFDQCEDYPAPAGRTPAARLAFLRQHHKRARAFYVNRQGRTVQQIVREEQLRRAINEYLDSADLTRHSPEMIRGAIVAFVAGRSDLRWALYPPKPPLTLWRIQQIVNLVVYPLVAIVLLPLLLLLSPVLFLLLRAHERRDIPDTVSRSRGNGETPPRR